MEKLFEAIVNLEKLDNYNDNGNSIQDDPIDISKSSYATKGRSIYGFHNSHAQYIPKNPHTKDGRLKRAAAAILYVAQHPGCIKDEIQAAIENEGWTSRNVELYGDLHSLGFWRRGREGRIVRYYPTYRALKYLKDVGLLDDIENIPRAFEDVYEGEVNDKMKAAQQQNMKSEDLNGEVDFEDD